MMPHRDEDGEERQQAGEPQQAVLQHPLDGAAGGLREATPATGASGGGGGSVPRGRRVDGRSAGHERSVAAMRSRAPGSITACTPTRSSTSPGRGPAPSGAPPEFHARGSLARHPGRGRARADQEARRRHLHGRAAVHDPVEAGSGVEPPDGVRRRGGRTAASRARREAPGHHHAGQARSSRTVPPATLGEVDGDVRPRTWPTPLHEHPRGVARAPPPWCIHRAPMPTAEREARTDAVPGPARPSGRPGTGGARGHPLDRAGPEGGRRLGSHGLGRGQADRAPHRPQMVRSAAAAAATVAPRATAASAS